MANSPLKPYVQCQIS